jgi:hypothetical protein
MMHRSYTSPLLRLLLQLFVIVSVYLFLDWVCHHGIWRQKKKTIKWRQQTNHVVLQCKCTVTDGVRSERPASKFLSKLWVAHMLHSAIVHSQRRVLSQKLRHKLRSGLNWQGPLKQSAVYNKGYLYFESNISGNHQYSIQTLILTIIITYREHYWFLCRGGDIRVTHKCCEVVVYGLALVINAYQHCSPPTQTHTNKFEKRWSTEPRCTWWQHYLQQALDKGLCKFRI